MVLLDLNLSLSSSNVRAAPALPACLPDGEGFLSNPPCAVGMRSDFLPRPDLGAVWSLVPGVTLYCSLTLDESLPVPRHPPQEQGLEIRPFAASVK